MDFIRTRTAKLRSLGKRLLTRRARASNSIAPAPAPEEVEQRQTSSSSRQASSRLRQASSRLRRLTRRAKTRIAPASEKVEQSQASPRQRSSSPRTKTLKREQAIADFSIRNRSKTAARKLQRSVRRARSRAIVSDEECGICLGPMLYPRATRTLICGHTFHRNCIDKWIIIDPSCPTCRQSIEPKRKHHLQQFIPNPGSATISDIKRANALIKGLRNAATIDEAILLLFETQKIIYNMQISDQEEITKKARKAWYKTHDRLQRTTTT